ncbi:hypothetical protein HN903_01820 [archaeon]|jgi:hypothetical protein|nr:hypothetical protein [archaeon]MBT7128471.1 hypothetical protein [archaeon]
MLRNFFRKKQKPKIELEKVNFNEIEDWLENKKNKLIKKEEEIFIIIKKRANISTSNISGKIKNLEAIDIESKKVEERAKIIVRQSLDKYLSFVEVFTKELTETKRERLSNFIEDTNQIFSDFDKRSYIFYQRANYLIGDELVAMKEEINDLSKYFADLFNKNEKIMHSLNLISSIQLKLAQLNEITTTLNEINSEIKYLDEKTTKEKERTNNILNEIKKVKISEDYMENLKKRNEIELVKKQLTDDISKLKSLIDFKKITNAFHSDENKMKIIKDYKENFQRKFEENKCENLLTLINEAELNNSSISNKIKQINKEKNKISENKKQIKKDEAKKLLEEIERIGSKLEYMAIEKIKNSKRSDKIKENREEIRESVSLYITELGGILSHQN